MLNKYTAIKPKDNPCSVEGIATFDFNKKYLFSDRHFFFLKSSSSDCNTHVLLEGNSLQKGICLHTVSPGAKVRR